MATSPPSFLVGAPPAVARAIATAVLLALGLAPASAAPRSAAKGESPAAARATRGDLEAARRRTAILESELALASTRKPYIVLDLGGRALRYRMMGMTMREVPIVAVDVEGLQTAEPAAGAPLVAGIFTLKEKENDPRLTPLSPEQVEEGADDENTANALPPEPPREFALAFKQPIAIEVVGRETRGGVQGMWGRFVGALRRWHGPGGGDETRLRVALHLDPEIAAEVYRSLVPDLRLLVLPPDGMQLPAAGQEAPPKPRAAKKAPPPPPKEAEPKEVPFKIPPPEDESGQKPPDEAAGTEEPEAPGDGAVPPDASPAPSPPTEPPPDDGGGRNATPVT